MNNSTCPFPKRLSVFRSLLWTLALISAATLVGAQEPSREPPPEERSTADPGSVVPPEGEGQGDSWGYEKAPEDKDADISGAAAEKQPRRAEVVRARLVGPSGHRFVKEVSRVMSDVGRMEWSRQGDWLAYDKVTDRGFRGLYIGTTGGSGRCLTCESWDLRKSHVLAPTWHPSGKVLVAMVQGPAKKLGLDTWRLAGPDRALHSDLWAFTVDGRDAWQLTQVVGQGGAVVDPVFSHEGDRLAWAQRVDTTVGGRWGSWEVRLSEFAIKRGLPRLGKVKRLNALPWPGFVSVHGFTNDDQGLLLTVTPSDRSRRGFMTGIYDLSTETFTPLPADGSWDSSPSAVPQSNRRIWVSDRGIERPRNPKLPWRGDLWFSSESGRRQERLTYFNDPSSEHYLEEAWIADTSWHPNGNEVILHVLTPGPTEEPEEYLYRLVLDPAISR